MRLVHEKKTTPAPCTWGRMLPKETMLKSILNLHAAHIVMCATSLSMPRRHSGRGLLGCDDACVWWAGQRERGPLAASRQRRYAHRRYCLPVALHVMRCNCPCTTRAVACEPTQQNALICAVRRDCGLRVGRARLCARCGSCVMARSGNFAWHAHGMLQGRIPAIACCLAWCAALATVLVLPY